MGNFEKLSVLVIGVIIVMILVVAIHTWTSDPAAPEGREIANVVGTPAYPPPPSPDVGRSDLADGASGNVWNDQWLVSPSDTPSVDATPTPPAVVPPSGEAAAPPEPPAPAEVVERKYTVKRGDTLGEISLEVYNTARHWEKIAVRNGVDPMALKPGMVLIIPPLEGQAPGASHSTSEGTGAANGPQRGATYKVRRGDTIQRISKAAFGTIERWPDIWLKNLERVRDPEDLPVGLELDLPN